MVATTFVLGVGGFGPVKRIVRMERSAAMELARLHRLGADGFWRFTPDDEWPGGAVCLSDIEQVSPAHDGSGRRSKAPT